MKGKEFLESVSRAANTALLKLKNNSPEILVVAGVVGVVTSVVLACKATTKVSPILEEAKENIDDIHEDIEEERMTKEESGKALACVYAKTGLKLAKLYAPAAGLGILSLSSLITSNGILRKRNVALSAAYAAVDKGFKEYKSRVADKLGEEIEREVRYGITPEEVTQTVTNENGAEQQIKKRVNVVEDLGYSPYARIFDELNPYFERSCLFNKNFLDSQLAYANKLFRQRGHLFLNEVYDILGFDRTKMGQVVGWVYDPENPELNNCIDFGMYNVKYKGVTDFLSEDEYAVILDFNVDGNILSMI